VSHVRYEILLPLRYNDGTLVEDAKLEQTRSELIDRFSALSVEPNPVQGLWEHEQVLYSTSLRALL